MSSTNATQSERTQEGVVSRGPCVLEGGTGGDERGQQWMTQRLPSLTRVIRSHPCIVCLTF